MKRDDDLDELKRELLAEQLRWFRRENEQRDREDFEQRIFDSLERKGYIVAPRGRRR